MGPKVWRGDGGTLGDAFVEKLCCYKESMSASEEGLCGRLQRLRRGMDWTLKYSPSLSKVFGAAFRRRCH